MVDRAIATMDMDPGTALAIKACNSVLQLRFPVRIDGRILRFIYSRRHPIAPLQWRVLKKPADRGLESPGKLLVKTVPPALQLSQPDPWERLSHLDGHLVRHHLALAAARYQSGAPQPSEVIPEVALL